MSWLDEAKTFRVMRAMPGPTKVGVSGAEVMRLTKLSSAAVYPRLRQLENEGLATSRRETDAEAGDGPRGTRWNLTARGVWRREGLR